MIINIRGTSGSGKSTLVRHILEEIDPYAVNNLLVDCHNDVSGHQGHANGKKVTVLGRYEKPTGGADNISPLSLIFDTAAYRASLGEVVLFEGLLVSRSKGRTLALHNERPDSLHVIHLSVSLDDCLKGVQARRDARGAKKPFNPAQTTATYHRVNKITADLAAAGVNVQYLNRSAAYAHLVRLLWG